MSIEQLHALFIQKKLTLSTAESCTGGQIAAEITSMPGCSDYYLGSIIAYSNEMKIKVLGVSETTLNSFGAVSKEVVKEMAEGMIHLSGSDYSLAVSGIAGPDGGTEEKPVGTVWCAIGKQGAKTETWLFQTQGTRNKIIINSTKELIFKLCEKIK